MKIGIIKEQKTPPDRRVVLTPNTCKQLIINYPELQIKVESSPHRVFSDDEYRQKGIPVTTDLSDCDVLLGVKEVPIEALIPDKKYFFFSHTIKKQPYNRELLRTILQKNIQLFDHETLVDEHSIRLVAFGYYAGLVGTYNGLRTLGLKLGSFELPKAETLHDANALKAELQKVNLSPIKILVTGKGRVGSGIKEILLAAGIEEKSAKSFLNKSYANPVFTQIDVTQYNKRTDGKEATKKDFYKNPHKYQSDFLKFARVADCYIAGHFYGQGAPAFFTLNDIESEAFKIQVIADISCDIKIPIPTTLRASTIANPIYGVHRLTGEETDFNNPQAIAVMAVDNLPCELPRDASEGFSKQFSEKIIPAFFDNDQNSILARAQMTQNGQLTPRFQYLSDYAGK
ncbi:MAG: alanine dehydrogenase [Bacteroidetes bacterium HGW-Bacteroidetes-13]|nr:MAG: alanine dehydrogenase [Bacteroidetes bacterium HGW-Bacteroidetes-13]